MANILRKIVSQNKTRYQDYDFDLDLSYILPNVIAMGYPSTTFEKLYRNPMKDIVRFLEQKHKGRYLVVNLCSEKGYSPKYFKNRALSFPFDDHGPPPLAMMPPFCEAVDEWLAAHPKNVVAVHCNAGKHRTGTMIGAYLLYKKFVRNTDQAEQFFGDRRTIDGQYELNPSQKRYLRYFEELISRSSTTFSLQFPPAVRLLGIEISPHLQMNAAICSPYFLLEQNGKHIYTSPKFEEDCLSQTSMILGLPEPVTCAGDIKLTFFNGGCLIKQEEMLHFWFNTFFVRKPSSLNQDITVCPRNACVSTNQARQTCGALPDDPKISSQKGHFLSVLNVSGGGGSASKGAVSNWNSGGTGAERILSLARHEMECNELLGPPNFTLTMYFLAE